MCRIYLSIPVTIDNRDKVIDTMISNIVGLKVGPTLILDHWKPGWIYDKQSVSKADIFIFAHPSNSFKFNLMTLPSGVLREFEQARMLGKQIFLAYKNTANEINFYKITANGSTISGMAGTTNGLAIRLEQEIFLKTSNKVQEPKGYVAPNTYKATNPCAEIPLDYNLGVFEPSKMDVTSIPVKEHSIELHKTVQGTAYDRRLLL